MLNEIIVMGRLCADPELRRTNTGTAVTSLTLACDRDFKGQDGEKETDFIDVVAWKDTAEYISKYFGKGRMAIVKGRLQMRDWTDKNGNKRKTAEVIADRIYFGDSKSKNEEFHQTPDDLQNIVNNAFHKNMVDNAFHELEDEGGLPF